jgi:hypothetical protein
MYKISFLLCGILVVLSGQAALAQNLGNSPYSKLGIGDVSDHTGNVRNIGMGGIGISTPNSFTVNFLNPALLIYNSRVTFEMAASGQYKSVANASKSQTSGTAGLGYLALALPIGKSWRSAVGLRPFSSVNYGSYTDGTVANQPNTQVRTGTQGEGTISEAFFANGVKVYKGLSLGVSGSYLFGSINRDAYSLIRDSLANPNVERLVINNQTTYNGLMFKGGLAYRQALGKKASLNLGAAYGVQNDLNYDSRTSHQRVGLNGGSLDNNPLNDEATGKITLPSFVQLGLSFDNNKSWVAGAEFFSRKWSGFRSESGAQELSDTYKISVGGEYTPDPASFDSYLKRVSYRAGLSYNKTPITIANTQLTNTALHAGFSFPIGSTPRPPEYNQSALNIGVALGKNGTTDNGLIRENYVQFNIGISLNSSWFIKPRID